MCPHLNDPSFDGGDSLATGKALAAAIGKEEFDLVLTGSQSDDDGFGSTGSIVAGHLAWPHAWLVMGVEMDEGGEGAKVTREMEGGMNEISHIRMPAVLQIQAGLNKPRYASLKGIMQAKRKEIAPVGPADLGLSVDEVGARGSGLEILSVALPETGEAAQIIEGEPAEAARILVEKLQKEARVL
jgi:electron transfer flavoprotein beta subunit